MESPARVDLHADRKVAFIRTMAFLNQDFTGADFKMEIRLTPDTPGTALVSLITVTTTAQGVRLLYSGSNTVGNHVTNGRLEDDIYDQVNPATGVNYVSGDTLTMSQIRITVNSSSMSGLPAADEVGDDLNLAYDLLITPASSSQDKWIYGAFVVRGTVTTP